MKIYKYLIIVFLSSLVFSTSCKKDPDSVVTVDPSNNLAIDSIVATKTNIVVWEEIYINVYTRGENIKYLWSTNHGSMGWKEAETVKYWACPSCLGLNTVKCEISNEFGSISDTIMINVN